MNNFRKIGPDEFGIACDDRYAPGTVITVTLRDGRTKQVTVGELALQTQQYGKWVYRQVQEPRSWPQSSPAVAVGNLSGIMAIFRRAEQHLKFPAIVLLLDTTRRADETEAAFRARVCQPGNVIRMHVAGERASAPGSLTICFDERDVQTGKRPWLGRVLQDGSFHPSREAPAGLGERLKAFAERPAEIASECGRLNGRCCFCNTKLSDARSTAVGYGATCADHFGMPWGSEKFSFEGAPADCLPITDLRGQDDLEREMQRLEAEGDRAETARDERNKRAARRAMERGA